MQGKETKMTKQESPMSKYTAFRCPEDLLELAKVKAKKDRRSLSNYIITLIEKDVRDMSLDDEARPRKK
jgi:predicted HicB family RNase H-like nuclease